jgi:hypothetical protein
MLFRTHYFIGQDAMLSFKELWELLLNGDRDDQFGALVIMISQYEKEMIGEIQTLWSKQISGGIGRGF